MANISQKSKFNIHISIYVWIEDHPSKNGSIPKNLRTDIVSALIQGKENEDAICHKKAPRLAMTLPVMKLLKALLVKTRMAHDTRRMIWTVCCMAFHGSFRIHELLSRNEDSFDPTTTLLGCDIKKLCIDVQGIKEDLLMIHLKAPKEDKLKKGVKVELFSTGTFACPLNAWIKWRDITRVPLHPTKPVFRSPNGSCFTGNMFNKVMKSVLGKW